MNRIGLIGAGHMGAAIARRLSNREISLTVYDRRREAAEALASAGAAVAESPAELAGQSDWLISVLPDGPDVEEVAYGEAGVFSGNVSDLLWLEMSTIHPEVTRKLWKEGASRNIEVADAAIGGLTVDAEEGRLLFMFGGSRDLLERASPLLSLLGRAVYCGPVGNGVTMKLVNNQLAGVTLAAVCEALLLGSKGGLSFDVMQEVMSGTAADNAHLHRSVPERILKGEFDPGFRMELMIKDARLALELAQSLHAPQLLASVVQQLRSKALHRGWKDKDTTIIARVLEELTGGDFSQIERQP